MIQINKKSEINKPIKIASKLELINMYNQYQNTLDNRTLEYLLSLINLEISVIKSINELNESDISFLNSLDIYKQILVYNIYHQALNIFKSDLHLRVVNDQSLGELYVQNLNNTIFDFKYGSDTKKITLIKFVSENKLKIKKIQSKINDLEFRSAMYKSHNMQKNADVCLKLINELRDNQQQLTLQENGYTNKENKKISDKYFEIMKEQYNLKLPEEFLNEGKIILKTMPNLTITANIKTL